MLDSYIGDFVRHIDHMHVQHLYMTAIYSVWLKDYTINTFSMGLFLLYKMIFKSEILTLIETLYFCGLTDIRVPICPDNVTHFQRVTKYHVYSFRIRKISNLFVL